MRLRAKNYANSYQLGIFACCREAEKNVYNFLPKSEVNAYYDFEMAKRIVEGNFIREGSILRRDSTDSIQTDSSMREVIPIWGASSLASIQSSAESAADASSCDSNSEGNAEGLVELC